MPTLPLFTPATSPDASCHVRAPGGYESQYFSAASGDSETQLIAGFHYGYPLDRGYARRYLLYRMFPTRIAPPEPMRYGSATLSVMHGGRVLCRIFERLPPHGPPRLVDEGDGSTQLSIAGFDFTFRPRAAPLCKPINDGPHHIVVTAPLCDVEGRMGWLTFAGLGCRDHRWGTRWPRETGGAISGGAFTAERSAMIYAFGDRAHVLDITPAACSCMMMEHSHPPSLIQRAQAAAGAQTKAMLCETIKPSRLASLLRIRGDR